MKKFFYLMSLCLCLFAGAAVMTSCGDDDEELDPQTSGIVEKGNTLQLTISTGYYKEIMTAEFNSNDECIKFTEKMVFESKDVCDAVWAEIKNDSDEDLSKYKKESKSITYDATDEYRGRTKASIRQYFEELQRYMD